MWVVNHLLTEMHIQVPFITPVIPVLTSTSLLLPAAQKVRKPPLLLLPRRSQMTPKKSFHKDAIIIRGWKLMYFKHLWNLWTYHSLCMILCVYTVYVYI